MTGDYEFIKQPSHYMLPNGIECKSVIVYFPVWGMRDDEGNEIPGCNWTIEVFNPAPWPIKIYPSKYYIQMIMFDLSEETDEPYNGRYMKQYIVPSGPREEKP